MIIQDKNYLITANNWFYAPNGKTYRAAWGKVKIYEDSILGVKTNRNSANWYLFVGSEEKGVIIAGCQIHYAIICDDEPNFDELEDAIYSSSGVQKFNRKSEIYKAQ
jgi:hypothetical protein